ncbi:MAG TPA: hypothetical protein VE645_19005 [Pseudonocardiaceae bacterium]|jgi:hypothetical protein|nr:hypothetical protein [Pseudonocardiaceae bacterium]
MSAEPNAGLTIDEARRRLGVLKVEWQQQARRDLLAEIDAELREVSRDFAGAHVNAGVVVGAVRRRVAELRQKRCGVERADSAPLQHRWTFDGEDRYCVVCGYVKDAVDNLHECSGERGVLGARLAEGAAEILRTS